MAVWRRWLLNHHTQFKVASSTSSWRTAATMPTALPLDALEQIDVYRLPAHQEHSVSSEPSGPTGTLIGESGDPTVKRPTLGSMHDLLDVGLVDAVQLLVCPSSRGKGVRIFDHSLDRELVEPTPFDNGIVGLRYDIKK